MLAGAVWPSLHEPSYLRRRTGALAGMRLLALAMPTNYDTALFDAMTPGLATGRFARVVNLYNVLMGGCHFCSTLMRSWAPGHGLPAEPGEGLQMSALVLTPAGSHAGLLVFLALVFRLPLRAHLRVQTASLAMLLLFGVHTHCRSQASRGAAAPAG